MVSLATSDLFSLNTNRSPVTGLFFSSQQKFISLKTEEFGFSQRWAMGKAFAGISGLLGFTLNPVTDDDKPGVHA